MAPVARELSRRQGVLEPLLSSGTLDGQLDELARCVEGRGEPPVALVGSSAGAWQCIILAARRPELASRLVLVGAPPFEWRFAPDTTRERMARMDAAGRAELLSLMGAMDRGEEGALARLGELVEGVDSYEAVPVDDPVEPSLEAFRGAWDEMAAMRDSGELMELAGRVRCPVMAVHGDVDPHPVDGVRGPLGGVLADFRCVVLERCGHRPWAERWAREAFYRLLENELGP